MEENPFKKLEEPPVPTQLKKKVMKSVEMSQLIIDMADLFVVKMGKSLTGLFRTKPNDTEHGTSK